MVPYVSVAVLAGTLVLAAFFATVSRVSLSILQGLHAYVLPEESDKTKGNNGAEKEAETAEALKKKSGRRKKEKFLFDEAGAQILRIPLAGESQLETRKYFQEYDEAIIYSCLGLISFATREVLQLISTSSDWAGALTPDDKISFMVSIFSVYKLLHLLSKVNYDPQLAGKSERLINWCIGFLGFFFASILLIYMPAYIVDFGIDASVLEARKSASVFLQKKGIVTGEIFAISPTQVKLLFAAVAGVLSGLLFRSTMRNVKCFWTRTDEMHGNISVLKPSQVARPVLNLSIVLPLLVTLLWVKPMAEIFVRPQDYRISPLFDSSKLDDRVLWNSQDHDGKDVGAGVGSRPLLPGDHKAESDVTSRQDTTEKVTWRPKSGEVELGLLRKKRIENDHEEEEDSGALNRVFVTRRYDWAASFGVSERMLECIRLWAMFLIGLLQILLFRLNLQTYCDGAILIWYECLHQSKAHNSELTKAKVFLNNYYVCRVALQSLVPGVLTVLLIGLARTRGSHLDSLVQEGDFLFAPSFVRSGMHFTSWWLMFSSALQTWVTLALFRLGIL